MTTTTAPRPARRARKRKNSTTVLKAVDKVAPIEVAAQGRSTRELTTT